MSDSRMFGRTYVDQTIDISGSQVVEYGGLVQVGQVGHVNQHLKLGRIHLLDNILLHCRFLLGEQYRVEDQINIIIL